jgi:hypothetical protein
MKRNKKKEKENENFSEAFFCIYFFFNLAYAGLLFEILLCLMEVVLNEI